MNILNLVSQLAPLVPDDSAPEWMVGLFRRRSISFASGLSDSDTRVFWMQSFGLTIDLRLPLEYEPAESDADEEAWYAHSVWDGNHLSWHGGISNLSENRWPEPAELRRVGNCMMEFAPSGIYVEDWRLQNMRPGPLIALEVLYERDLTTGQNREVEGALILAGDYLGSVLQSPRGFEACIAVCEQSGTESTEFVVQHSLQSRLCGLPFKDIDGFFLTDKQGEVAQRLETEDGPVERVYRIDTLLESFDFSQSTQATPDAETWYGKHQPTLGRYLRRFR